MNVVSAQALTEDQIDSLIYDALSEIVDIDTSDVNLRDHPKAWEVMGRLREAICRQEPEAVLPPAYMLAKLAMVMPLFQEARDALTALSEPQRVRHGISKTLAGRMDIAGTYSLDDWRAAMSAPTPQPKE